MRLLLFNLATDADDPILGFTTGGSARWRSELNSSRHYDARGQVEVPANVRVYSVGKEKGYSEPRRAIEFYQNSSCVSCERPYRRLFFAHDSDFHGACCACAKAKGIPIVTWY